MLSFTPVKIGKGEHHWFWSLQDVSVPSFTPVKKGKGEYPWLWSLLSVCSKARMLSFTPGSQKCSVYREQPVHTCYDKSIERRERMAESKQGKKLKYPEKNLHTPMEVKRGENGAAPECKGGENGRSPRKKKRRPTASYGTIPKCENLGAIPLGIELGSAIGSVVVLPSFVRGGICGWYCRWSGCFLVVLLFPSGRCSIPTSYRLSFVPALGQGSPVDAASIHRAPDVLFYNYYAYWPFTIKGGGHGGVAVSLLASHKGEPGSIPGFSHVGIVPDDATGGAGFLGVLPFSPRPVIPGVTPYSPRFALISFRYRDVKNCANSVHGYFALFSSLALGVLLPGCYSASCKLSFKAVHGKVSTFSSPALGVLLPGCYSASCKLSFKAVHGKVSTFESPALGVLLPGCYSASCKLSFKAVHGKVSTFSSPALGVLLPGCYSASCKLSFKAVHGKVSTFESPALGVLLPGCYSASCKLSSKAVHEEMGMERQRNENGRMNVSPPRPKRHTSQQCLLWTARRATVEFCAEVREGSYQCGLESRRGVKRGGHGAAQECKGWGSGRSPRKPADQRFPASSLPDFRVWEPCLTTPQTGGFSRGSPVSPALAFRRYYIPRFTLIGSQDLSHTLRYCTSVISKQTPKARHPIAKKPYSARIMRASSRKQHGKRSSQRERNRTANEDVSIQTEDSWNTSSGELWPLAAIHNGGVCGGGGGRD
ncbi:hypothetical protein PR048_031265 [Dryococelus australis]|uniref:Uncharacterized protein n=1 Tax=Dryococelus australis TaxID=614101 RepID=A0ABQ9G7W2_9NEOP|nr:hypothetical protein PR048_031265 [Dryococelus australis]